MDSIVFIILRRMRAPLILLIAVYAIAITGLVLIPGVDAQGRAAPPLSFFHAFYFVSFTASTIGFGEIPSAFSEAQRFWVVFCIYMTVISWSTTLITLLALFQDRNFLGAVARIRFAHRVSRIGEAFHLVCGCGETGSLVGASLDLRGERFVAIDCAEAKIRELELRSWRRDVPALIADARIPETLLRAGLRHRFCRAVLALTDDEEANLAIAIAVRLLNPEIPVLARVRSPAIAANMASFGTDHVINAFEIFARQLAQAVHSPGVFRLHQWLTGIPGEEPPPRHYPPSGRWIVCGYGRFGQAVIQELEHESLPITLIAPERDRVEGRERILGTGTQAEELLAAGVLEASGIVAGTDNDVNNLSIAVTARELKPDIFVVLRQNHATSTVLLDAFEGEFAMVQTRLVAERCLAILTTPLLERFLAEATRLGDAWADRFLELLRKRCGEQLPLIWSVRLDAKQAVAITQALRRGRAVHLRDLLADSSALASTLPALSLLLLRRGNCHLLPEAGEALEAGDEILFAGRARARHLQGLTLENANALDYVLRGRDRAHAWIWQWFERQRRLARKKARRSEPR